MVDPYHPPESDTDKIPDSPEAGHSAPLVGCGLGGCLHPTLLFFGCAIFLGDTGGPLFWPIIAVPLGFIGMIGGFIYRSSRR